MGFIGSEAYKNDSSPSSVEEFFILSMSVVLLVSLNLFYSPIIIVFVCVFYLYKHMQFNTINKRVNWLSHTF